MNIKITLNVEGIEKELQFENAIYDNNSIDDILWEIRMSMRKIINDNKENKNNDNN